MRWPPDCRVPPHIDGKNERSSRWPIRISHSNSSSWFHPLYKMSEVKIFAIDSVFDDNGLRQFVVPPLPSTVPQHPDDSQTQE
jgi:hypothetical protein